MGGRRGSGRSPRSSHVGAVGVEMVALQPRADSTDRQPILQDLDVITAVRGICSGQTSYTVETLHQRFRSFERNAYPSIVMFLPRMSDYTLTASKQ